MLADPESERRRDLGARNTSGGWHHPAHVHFIDFKMLDRNGKPPLPHERGAKDVVYLGENETVRLLIKFDAGRAAST